MWLGKVRQGVAMQGLAKSVAFFGVPPLFKQTTWQGKVRLGMARFGMVRLRRAWSGSDWRGMARLFFLHANTEALQGGVGRGMAWHGMAWRGEANFLTCEHHG